MTTEAHTEAAEAGERLEPQNHTIWFVNRYSTNADLHLDEFQGLLEEQGEDATWIDTTQDDECAEQLLDALLAHDKIELITGGGDGTLHRALKVIMALDPAELAKKEIIIDVVGLGQENDVAHMLHGKDFNNLGAVLNGEVQQIRPLLIQKQTSAGEWEHINTAAAYFGRGGTARGAQLANEPGYREINARRPETAVGRLRKKVAHHIANLKLAGRSLGAKYVGERGWRSDFTVTNGERMAGRFRFPSRLDRPGFYVSETRRNIAAKAISIADRLNPFGWGVLGQMVHGHHTFEVKQPTLAHVDGENYTLEPGTYKISESRLPIGFRAAKK